MNKKSANILVVLERNNGYYGGYEVTRDGHEQVFNTSAGLLFSSIKMYADKGYSIQYMEKEKEYEFMLGRLTLDDYLKT